MRICLQESFAPSWIHRSHIKGRYSTEASFAHTVPFSGDASDKNHFAVSHLSLLVAERSSPGDKRHSHLQCPLQGKDKLSQTFGTKG